MKNILKIFVISALLIIPLSQIKAETIANRLKGQILLQVESHGEAYYIHPTSSTAYYMANGDEAYNIMRDLGIGITNKDLEKITTNKTFAKKYSGKIFLQVEFHGEAYYIDFNGEPHYLKNGADAYKIMRGLGLGITNKDLEKIEISKVSAVKNITNNSDLPNSVNINPNLNNAEIGNVSCTKDEWSCEDWSNCSYSGIKTRVCTLTVDCAEINSSSPALSQSCNYETPTTTCSSWTYSNWTPCSNNSQQTRTAISSSPSGCVGGSPVLAQSCAYIPSVCTSWVYSNWGTCTNGQQTRTVISSSPANCSNGNSVLNQNCTTQPADCTSWTYSDWSSCQSNGLKTRSIVSSSPNNCSGGNPELIQSCTYTVPVCTSWNYSNWSTCSSDGQQTRNVVSSLPNGCTNGNPILIESCVYTPKYLMPDKPIIESFCDDKENCVHSLFADSNSSSSLFPYPIIHVGETLNFTIKVSGEETSGVLAFILPQEYDWVKEGGIKPWGTGLTYTKTFSTEDISTRYFMYAYIKSSNDNYHRRSSGCNWIYYSCDDSAQIIYTVLP